MKPYGVKRNWTEVEDDLKDRDSNHPENHTRIKKIKHRAFRRVIRYILHLVCIGRIDAENL